MEAREKQFAEGTCSSGSALILTVVLTSMLAIVGVLFVMMARVDKVATSAISENRELNLAVETVIARISQELVSDIPGVVGQEYYDYPDAGNAWLASLEPYQFAANDYRWRQISDVYRFFGSAALDLPAVVVADHVKIDPCDLRADADGDGVADSRWGVIPNITSSKGKPIYAAIRVVDNEAMLNVNTGFKFDPNFVDANLIDGSSQLQINLMALSWRPGVTIYDPCDEIDLLEARANPALGLNPFDLYQYQRNVIWQYYKPRGVYTPFDISDELELRYRFLVNHDGIDTRLEELGNARGRSWEFRRGTFRTPAQAGKLDEWFMTAYYDGMFDPNYAYRHLATTYNMDRIIDPMGGRMININNGNTPVGILYDRLLSSLGPVIADPNIVTQYAQLAANIIDFSDDDDINFDGVLDFNCVTTLVDPYGIPHYGFEAQPFINEIAWKIGPSPPVTPNYFALELYNPFNKAIDLRDFVLEFVNRSDPADQYSIVFPAGQLIEANSYFVIVNANVFSIYTDPNAPTAIRVEPALRFFDGWISSDSDRSRPPVDRRPDADKSKPPIPQGAWGNIYDMSLLRSVLVPAPGTMIYVDNQIIDSNLALPGSTRAYGRDDRDWRVIYQTLREDIYAGSLGMANYFQIPPALFPTHLFSFFLPNPLYPRARFITVGDIPRILTLGHSITPNSTIGRQLMGFELLEISTAVDQENRVRLNLRDPNHRNVFQNLTVFDPVSDFIDNDGDGLGIDLNSDGFLDINETDLDEVKIPGRININTAPWYVIAQLPWMTNEIAQAIVAYRDKLGIPVDYRDLFPPPALPTGRFNATGIVGIREQPGFASIGELNFVIAGINNFNVGLYALDTFDLPAFPDLTTDGPGMGDGIADDFEERDIIFSRISNLVTVRSDVFTAYILVRIGADGPQKRVVAILDRSGVDKTNVGLPNGKVRIVALHYVPDPR
ncbi:MAG: hypothetical protein FVQ85_14155 [Planctomycetes bacterium]|nr:hypothetical protein [Planctomycetota bacterium]